MIGAGGAGMRAAIESSALGATTALVCKSLLGKAHTVMAEGGIAAALGNVDAADDWTTHFQDTMSGGKYLNNWRMAELHAKEAPDRVRELERWGGIFDRTPAGHMSQRAFGGHTHRRLVHIGDRTGLELIRTLQDRCTAQDVDVFMECTITHLLKDGDRVSRRVRLLARDRRVRRSSARKAFVLATGGTGRCYEITSNSWECTGDGHALAYEAGAELVDMEFVQFHPTGMVWPPGVRGLLVTEAVRGEGGMLTQRRRRALHGALRPAAAELSTRDIVARAIYTEVAEGRGSPRGGVFLDVSHLPRRHVRKKLPSMYAPVPGARRRRHHQGADGGRADVPLHHGRHPGRRRDRRRAASSGLFAAGECAGGLSRRDAARRQLALRPARLRPARRRGRRRVRAEAAAGGASTTARSPPRRGRARALPRDAATNPYALHAELQQAMQAQRRHLPRRGRPDRGRGGDRGAEARVRATSRGGGAAAAFNPGWHLWIDLRNMLVCAEAIARAALRAQRGRAARTAALDFPRAVDRLGPAAASSSSKDGERDGGRRSSPS